MEATIVCFNKNHVAKPEAWNLCLLRNWMICRTRRYNKHSIAKEQMKLLKNSISTLECQTCTPHCKQGVRNTWYLTGLWFRTNTYRQWTTYIYWAIVKQLQCSVKPTWVRNLWIWHKKLVICGDRKMLQMWQASCVISLNVPNRRGRIGNVK